MTDTLRARAATIDDLDLLVPLFDSYRQFYGRPSEPDVCRDFLRNRFIHMESWIFLGLVGDTPGGFAQLYPSFSSVRAAKILILNDLYVSVSARRRGVAACLLETSAQFARSIGCAKLTLSTAISNKAAQALYESHGWKRDTDYYEYNFNLDVARLSR